MALLRKKWFSLNVALIDSTFRKQAPRGKMKQALHGQNKRIGRIYATGNSNPCQLF